MRQKNQVAVALGAVEGKGRQRGSAHSNLHSKEWAGNTVVDTGK